jgi:hypothetical protein
MMSSEFDQFWRLDVGAADKCVLQVTFIGLLACSSLVELLSYTFVSGICLVAAFIRKLLTQSQSFPS